ncbi:MAG: large conductance mechanosensitive channel protein MscL [Eubacterium sp.]|jgi:large conductance mechanosensitive channel protein|nr:large conductance mechanosensitive channel protein MscL [Eubacterium sp.]
MLKEFREFALKGSMVDLAVGMIIGSAFTGIVNSLVNDLVMPLLGLLTGNIDFSNLFIALDGNHYDSLAAAEAAEAAVFKYGSFISNVINFIIVAFVIFLVVRQINKIRNKFAKPEPEAVPTTKICPYCRSEIDINATRCPHCTSEQTDSL